MAGWAVACVVTLVCVWLLIAGQPAAIEQQRLEVQTLKTQVAVQQTYVPTVTPTSRPHYCSPTYYMYCYGP